MIRWLIILTIAFCVTRARAGWESDGVDDACISSSNVSYGNNVITVTFWLYAAAFANDSDVAISSGVSGDTDAWFVQPNDSSGNVRLGSTGTTGSRLETFARPTTGWHHWAAVFDNSTAAGNVKLFIDGVEISTVATTNSKTGTSNFADRTLYLLSRGAANYFNGTITAVGIHPSELSLSRIKFLASSRLKYNGWNSIQFWRLDSVAHNANADGATFRSDKNLILTASDGANNTGCLGKAETYISLP